MITSVHLLVELDNLLSDGRRGFNAGLPLASVACAFGKSAAS
jgi:hypothetical protein